MKYAILAVLCLAGTVFGAYSYDTGTKTLNMDQADLVNVIDPAGLADVQQSFGVTIADFRLLPGLKVVDFGHPTGVAAANPTSLQVNGLVKFNFPTVYANTGDTGYWWGGRNSYGRSAFSGVNTYDDISTCPDLPGEYLSGTQILAESWFSVTSITGANVTAVGFGVCSHDSGGYALAGGLVKFLLDDGTNATVDYPQLGTGTSPMLNKIWIGYQAPTGRHIVGFYAVRNGGGTSNVGIDDLSFVAQQAAIQPHAGDANNDGAVDVIDLGVLATNYDKTGLATSATDPFGAGSWKLADFNNDGNVDVIDLGVLATNYDWAGAPATAAVPEPGSAAMLTMGALALLRRYTRK